jgi:hypothetical protein
MAFENTSLRLWKHLSREEKLAAATHFWQEPPPALVPTALAALVAARKLRPQAARALPHDQQAKILASVLDPGEPLSAFLLASLHLGDRRPILRSFLDAVGLPHEDGMLKPESDDMALDKDKVQAAVQKIAAEFPRAQVDLYLNVLWLQDPDRWGLLEQSADWMPAAKA